MNLPPGGHGANGSAPGGLNMNNSADAVSAFMNLLQAAANVQSQMAPGTQFPSTYSAFLPQNHYGFQNMQPPAAPQFLRAMPSENQQMMVPQGFPNMQPFHQYRPGIPQFQNLSGFNMFNMPMLSPHAQNDAAQPEPMSRDDEDFLVRTLHASVGTGQRSSDVIATLHGVRNHSLAEWTKLYIDNSNTILARVAAMAAPNQPVAAAQPRGDVPAQSGKHRPMPAGLPTPATQRKKGKLEAAGPSRSAARASGSQNPPTVSRPVHAQRKHMYKSTSTRLPAHKPAARRRSPNTSSSARRARTAYAKWGIPEPPSRSPTPPVPVPPKPMGNPRFSNLYTEEDKEFYIKSILWYLKQDPTLCRSRITRYIHKKAKHHSLLSWGSHYKTHAELVDKIFAWAKSRQDEDDEPTEDSDSDTDHRHFVPSNPLVMPIQGSDEESELSGISTDEPDTEDDITNMGDSGDAYTDADMRILARYIASKPKGDWEEMTFKERWEGFHAKYLRRTPKSWAVYYRWKGTAIDRLAKKYRLSMLVKRNTDSQPNGATTSGPKRRLSTRDMEDQDGHGAEGSISPSKGKEREVVDVIDLTMLDEDFKHEDW